MADNTLVSARLRNFTVFSDVEFQFAAGLNVLVGVNATGKTHLLKLLYASHEASHEHLNFADKLAGVFVSDGRLGKLSSRRPGMTSSQTHVVRGDGAALVCSFNSKTHKPADASVQGIRAWRKLPVYSTYIPVKEMLAHATGFRSLLARHELAFEEVYADIIDRAFYPSLKGPRDTITSRMLDSLRKCMDGRVESTADERFFLVNRQGRIEFPLVAEGVRKLALIWLLIQNGWLRDGAALFWDEPEANLNPAMVQAVVEILLTLARHGCQIFVASHSYFVLKEIDLQSSKNDKIKYFALSRDEDGRVTQTPASTLSGISPNAIQDTFMGLYGKEMARAVGTKGKSR